MDYSKPFRLRLLIIICMLVFLTTMNVHPASNVSDRNTTIIQPDAPFLDLSVNSNVSNFDFLFTEDFETTFFPPKNWSLINENKNYSWYRDSLTRYTGNYSASCLHDPRNNLQDEWLITPEINITGYTEIYLYFNWFMSYFWSVSPYDYYDFNVCILTNEMQNFSIIWSEEDIGSFENWIWYNTTKEGNSLDISSYRENQIIRIGFQYSGCNGAKLNIDDIGVYGRRNTNLPIVDAGGPYYGYVGEEIIFYGNVSGGEPGYKWNWDFGDGGQSSQKNPTHVYDRVGNYSVSLDVTDKSDASSSDVTIAHIMNMSKIPELVIVNITGLVGLHATISNQGCIDAYNVEWEIHFTGGSLNNIEECTTGKIDCIHRCCCCKIGSELFMGFGIVKIDILVDATNMQRINKQVTAVMFGNYVYPFSDWQ
jgi:hypothetical protein